MGNVGLVVCMDVGIGDLLAALREFPGCRTRTGVSSASRGPVVGNVGLVDGQCWAGGVHVCGHC